MHAADRWWFWAVITGLTVFAAGYAARSGTAIFWSSLPFILCGVIYGSLETRRLVNLERTTAIREATRIAERVRRMDVIT